MKPKWCYCYQIKAHTGGHIFTWFWMSNLLRPKSANIWLPLYFPKARILYSSMNIVSRLFVTLDFGTMWWWWHQFPNTYLFFFDSRGSFNLLCITFSSWVLCFTQMISFSNSKVGGDLITGATAFLDNTNTKIEKFEIWPLLFLQALKNDNDTII